MNTLIKTCAVSIFVLQALAAAAEAQPKEITKEEYDRAFEKAEQAKTYPHRETINFKSYTYYDSSDALHADEGEEILSQVAVTEYSRADRLRTTLTTETEKGKKVEKFMQIDWECYTFAGTRWKKTESCNVSGLTMAMRPDKEEYSVESTKLEGVNVRIYRHIETIGSGRSETGFVVDAKGRMIRQEGPNDLRTYEYGVRIKPVTLPRRSTAPKTRKLGASRK